MNRTAIKTIFFVTLASLLFTSCTSDDLNKQDIPVSTTTPTQTTAEIIYDDLDIHAEDDKELYIMRVKDHYIELSNECEEVYYIGSGSFPTMDDGEIVRAIADVDIYNGGEAGYSNNSFIKNLKSFSDMDYPDAVSKFNIPEITGNDFSYGRRVLHYTNGDDTYLAVLNYDCITLYKNGENVLDYEHDSGYGILEPVYDFLIDHAYGIPAADVSSVPLDLSEDDIINMDEIELRSLWKLAAEGILKDAATPNHLRDDYDLRFEDGYIGIGKFARVSAETEEEALEIAKKSWIQSTCISYDNISLIVETDEFWLYKADYSMNGTFKAIDTLIVYKKDYYDAALKTAFFELSDESIRHFFACQTVESVEPEMWCIGEYVDEDENGKRFSRYYLQITHDDNTSAISIYETEYHINADGRITQTDHPAPLHEVKFT